jgi:hypothetical protein
MYVHIPAAILLFDFFGSFDVLVISTFCLSTLWIFRCFGYFDVLGFDVLSVDVLGYFNFRRFVFRRFVFRRFVFRRFEVVPRKQP